MYTEPAPPWPNFLDGLKYSVALSSVSYLKFKLDLLIIDETFPRFLRSRQCKQRSSC